jgi:hypothetical protein
MLKFTVADRGSCEQCGMYKVLPVCGCNCQVYKCQNYCTCSLTPRHFNDTTVFTSFPFSVHTCFYIRVIILYDFEFCSNVRVHHFSILGIKYRTNSYTAYSTFSTIVMLRLLSCCFFCFRSSAQ